MHHLVRRRAPVFAGYHRHRGVDRSCGIDSWPSIMGIVIDGTGVTECMNSTPNTVCMNSTPNTVTVMSKPVAEA